MTPIAPHRDEYHDLSFQHTFEDTLDTLFLNAGIECLGVCEMPYCLQEALEAIAPKINSLKLLHIRLTGKKYSTPLFFDLRNSFVDADDWEQAQASLSVGHFPVLEAQWTLMKDKTWREEEKKELESFANWAFGENGFPNLRVIAYGDFSYERRFAHSQRLLCRETHRPIRNKKWRPVQIGDVAHHELIEENMDMLSACPVSQLIWQAGRSDIFPGLS